MNPVTDLLRKLQLAGRKSADKFVPPEYLYNTPDVRLGVMQGLLDTDGGPVTQDGRTCRIQYTTTSPRLARGHGLPCSICSAELRIGGRAVPRDADPVGRVVATSTTDPTRTSIEIRLARRHRRRSSSRANAISTTRTAADGRCGSSDQLEPAGEQETVCIKVAAPDSLYITNDFLVTHNTLNEAFIILDEAQNATPAQMKMFLTRLGYGAQAVVNGDITQIDLDKDQKSGLVAAREILQRCRGHRVRRLRGS